MKPEYEDRIKKSIRELEAWFQAGERSRFERRLIGILDHDPEGAVLVEQLHTLSARQEFIESRAPKILQHARDAMENTPTADEWNRVQKNLIKYLKQARDLPGSDMYWLMTDVWAMGETPERSFLELVSELKERIEKISAIRKTSKKDGRHFESWQVLLVEDLETAFRQVLSIEPARTINSLFTQMVQAFLQELINKTAFSDRRKIVSDIYKAKMDKYP